MVTIDEVTAEIVSYCPVCNAPVGEYTREAHEHQPEAGDEAFWLCSPDRLTPQR